MSRKSAKNITKARALVEPRPYAIGDAIPLLQKAKYAKFDETVDLTLRLGVDTRHADQMVRGTVVLPHGLGGKSPRLWPSSPRATRLRKPRRRERSSSAARSLVEKIQKENWTGFDALIATPDMMRSVGKLGKVLGPRGLMPNPKTGTVTTDVAGAIAEIKAGKVEFRADKTALVHVPVGKLSFSPEKLQANAMVVISSVVKAKPSAAKGKYIKRIILSSTMGPGIELEPEVAEVAAKV
jgi:large subunit ribosomal protein L1